MHVFHSAAPKRRLNKHSQHLNLLVKFDEVKWNGKLPHRIIVRLKNDLTVCLFWFELNSVIIFRYVLYSRVMARESTTQNLYYEP